eukprot:TRINITY_DN66706_c0_g1_i1.p1 TRINITY_DN66706_c0_g1~~TRINITY_DN66706_c0_g1_i1.p1  ORF type:complete len:111 (-),score=4.33 TRINITY_DN66706_c0_g1_i1:186-518(-)
MKLVLQATIAGVRDMHCTPLGKTSCPQYSSFGELCARVVRAWRIAPAVQVAAARTAAVPYEEEAEGHNESVESAKCTHPTLLTVLAAKGMGGGIKQQCLLWHMHTRRQSH